MNIDILEDSNKIIIHNVEKYTIEFIDCALILTPKSQNISENDIINNNLINSKILKCIIKNDKRVISENDNKYFKILKNVWKSIDIEQILDHTTFNIKKTNEDGINGFNWFDDLNLSVQPKDANGTMKEIIKMIQISNYSLDMSIKLESGKIINILF